MKIIPKYTYRKYPNANEKINASKDSILSLCCNGTFGGSPVFDNVLANSPKRSNKCVFINKALN